MCIFPWVGVKPIFGKLNVYKWFLETFYGCVVSDLYLIILHPDNKNYRRLRLNILEEEVADMLECRKRALREKSSSSVLLPMPSSAASEDTDAQPMNTSFGFVEDT